MGKYNLFLGTLFSFFYIYDINLTIFPTIFSSRKIVFFILLVLTFARGKSIYVNKKLSLFFILNVFILIYILLISYIYRTYNFEYSIINRLFFYTLYVSIGSILIIHNLKNNMYLFFLCVRNAGIIQGILILFLFYSQNFRSFANMHILNSGNISFMRITDRGTGIGAEGAFLTILLLMSLICAICLIKNQKNIIFNYIIIIFLMYSMFLVGRTGLYCSIILILLILIKKGKSKFKINKRRMLLFLCMFFLFLGTVFKIYDGYENNLRIQKQVNLFTGIFDFQNGDRSILQLKEMIKPELKLDSIFGYGIYRGEFHNNVSQHDGGYIQSFFALGLIGSVFYYFSILFILFKGINEIKKTKWFKIYIIVSVILFIIEIKEPFFIKAMPLSFMIIYKYLIIKESTDNMIQSNSLENY